MDDDDDLIGSHRLEISDWENLFNVFSEKDGLTVAEELKNETLAVIVTVSSLCFASVTFVCYLKEVVWPVAKVVGGVKVVIAYTDREAKDVEELICDDWIWIKKPDSRNFIKNLMCSVSLPSVIVMSSGLDHIVTEDGVEEIYQAVDIDKLLRHWKHSSEKKEISAEVRNPYKKLQLKPEEEVDDEFFEDLK